VQRLIINVSYISYLNSQQELKYRHNVFVRFLVITINRSTLLILLFCFYCYSFIILNSLPFSWVFKIHNVIIVSIGNTNSHSYEANRRVRARLVAIYLLVLHTPEKKAHLFPSLLWNIIKPFSETFPSYVSFWNQAWGFKTQAFGIFPKKTVRFVSK
jgi:hypothetical protein